MSMVDNVDFGGLKNEYDKELILNARAMNMTVNEYKIHKKEKNEIGEK